MDRPVRSVQAPAPLQRVLDRVKPRRVAGFAAGPVKVQPDRLRGRQALQRADEPVEGAEVVQRHAEPRRDRGGSHPRPEVPRRQLAGARELRQRRELLGAVGERRERRQRLRGRRPALRGSVEDDLLAGEANRQRMAQLGCGDGFCQEPVRPRGRDQIGVWIGLDAVRDLDPAAPRGRAHRPRELRPARRRVDPMHVRRARGAWQIADCRQQGAGGPRRRLTPMRPAPIRSRLRGVGHAAEVGAGPHRPGGSGGGLGERQSLPQGDLDDHPHERRPPRLRAGRVAAGRRAEQRARQVDPGQRAAVDPAGKARAPVDQPQLVVDRADDVDLAAARPSRGGQLGDEPAGDVGIHVGEVRNAAAPTRAVRGGDRGAHVTGAERGAAVGREGDRLPRAVDLRLQAQPGIRPAVAELRTCAFQRAPAVDRDGGVPRSHQPQAPSVLAPERVEAPVLLARRESRRAAQAQPARQLRRRCVEALERRRRRPQHARVAAGGAGQPAGLVRRARDPPRPAVEQLEQRGGRAVVWTRLRPGILHAHGVEDGVVQSRRPRRVGDADEVQVGECLAQRPGHAHAHARRRIGTAARAAAIDRRHRLRSRRARRSRAGSPTP